MQVKLLHAFFLDKNPSLDEYILSFTKHALCFKFYKKVINVCGRV